MKSLTFEYRDGTEYVSWVGNTDEAGSSTVSDLQKSQPGTWKLCEAAYEAWKAETTKPEDARKAKAAEAAKGKKAAEEEEEEDSTWKESWKANDKTKGTKR